MASVSNSTTVVAWL